MLKRKVLGQIGLLTGIGAVLPGVIGGADAASITQTKNFAVAVSPAEVTDPGEPSNSDDKSTTVTFNQFDPSLGTLTEIDLSLKSNLFTFLTVSGSNVEEQDNSTATWDGSVTLTTPDGADFSDSHNYQVSCDFGNCNNSTTPSFTENGSKSITSSFAPGFFGTGEWDAVYELDLTVSVSNNFNGEPASSGGGSGSWDGAEGLTVTYIYTPNASVPEPDTLALLGLAALAGMGVARRRPKDET